MTDSTMSPRIQAMIADLASDRAATCDHPLFAALSTIDDVRILMSHHVFAVWDFMLLLKRLQRDLTCVGEVWRPVGDAWLRRTINEIVVGEECDEDGRGGYLSHLELYIEAAGEVGADLRPATDLLRRLAGGAGAAEALAACGAPSASRRFVSHTYDVLAGSTHEVAAAFAIGREDVLPHMFTELIRQLSRAEPGRVDRLLFYLQRHVDLDGDDHGPAALRMLAALCGADERRWREATAAGRHALRARVALWDGVMAQITAARERRGQVEASVPAR